jgi:hypothetical protein
LTRSMLTTRRRVALTLTMALAGMLVGCPPLGDLGTDGGIEAGADSGPDHAPPHDAVGGDACNADPASDPRNCGRCGHDCAGGACKGGVCQPYAIATGTKFTYGIAVRSGMLYFTTSFFTVETCTADNCGSTLTQMTSNYGVLRGLTTDTTNVYWANAGFLSDAGFNGTIATCGLAGCPSGAETVLAPLEGQPIDVAVNTSALYWTDDYSGLVRSCSVGGCEQAPTTLATDPTTLSGVAVDSTSIYWAESTLGNIIKCPLEGCPTFTPFATGSVTPAKIDVANGTVYWTTNGAILSCPSTGCGGKPTVFAKDQPFAYGISDDGTNLYWTLLEPDGKVLSCPLSGCTTPVVLGDMQASPWGVVADATSVYWTNSSGSTVMRVMK